MRRCLEKWSLNQLFQVDLAPLGLLDNNNKSELSFRLRKKSIIICKKNELEVPSDFHKKTYLGMIVEAEKIQKMCSGCCGCCGCCAVVVVVQWLLRPKNSKDVQWLLCSGCCCAVVVEAEKFTRCVVVVVAQLVERLLLMPQDTG